MMNSEEVDRLVYSYLVESGEFNLFCRDIILYILVTYKQGIRGLLLLIIPPQVRIERVLCSCVIQRIL